jgi:AraC-like DNA-binding protein
MPHLEQKPRHEELRAVLAETIERWTRGAEDVATPIAGLSLFRREALTPPGLCLIEPSVVLAVQGRKRMLVGEGNYDYDSNHFLIASLDIPASSQVLEASPERPSLGLTMQLDLRVLTELVAQTHLPPVRDRTESGGVALGTVTPPLLEAFGRLTALLDEPDAIGPLAPLVQRELHYRLLAGDQSGRLRQLTAAGSQSHAVARAIEWLKLNYARPLRIEELADRVHLSTSSLHHHFRALTAMTPLQYQKWLRLNEARRLMLTDGFDATRAAFEVGYESPSQFSREYSRLFGAPPRRDVVSLRQGAAAPAH